MFFVSVCVCVCMVMQSEAVVMQYKATSQKSKIIFIKIW